jgi:hypothetical protein
VRIRPSIIIWRDDSSQFYRSVEAIAGFRDAIAISVVPYGWAQLLRFDHNPDILYANWFSVYPWMIDKNYEYVVMRSMAQLALHLVEEIKPQSTPGVTPRNLIPRMIDFTLLNALLKRWPLRYHSENSAWEHIALFRSLNMANAAALLPANAEVTTYDIGRSVALWVSAFEILVHPGQGKVGFLQVYDILDKVEWRLTECKEKIHQTHGYEPGRELRNLACWVYGLIYKARNEFLHGNPVTGDTLVVRQSKRHLLQYAPVLYRMALTGFLNLKWDQAVAEGEVDTSEAGFHFGCYQSDMEAALATVLITKEEREAQRQSLLKRL